MAHLHFRPLSLICNSFSNPASGIGPCSFHHFLASWRPGMPIPSISTHSADRSRMADYTEALGAARIVASRVLSSKDLSTMRVGLRSRERYNADRKQLRGSVSAG